MGVTGLWSVLDGEKAGRPVNSYDNLRGQRLAVDASIWIYQLSRVSLKNSHSRNAFIASGIFRRLAKLCHFGILPVFVFDGMPPLLKREELRRRQAQRQKSEVDVKKIAERILQAKLKLLAAGGVPNAEPKSVVDDDDIFKLKSESGVHYTESESEEYDSEEDEQDDIFKKIDIDSPSFKRLPEDLQLDILYQLRERMYGSSFSAISQIRMNQDDESIDPRELTKVQIDAIKRRHAITTSIDRLKRGLTGSNLDGVSAPNAKARKIASSDRRAFVLVKNEGHGYTFTPSSSIQPNVDAEPTLADAAKKDSEDEFMAEFFGETPVESSTAVAKKIEVAMDRTVDKQESTEVEIIDRKETDTIASKRSTLENIVETTEAMEEPAKPSVKTVIDSKTEASPKKLVTAVSTSDGPLKSPVVSTKDITAPKISTELPEALNLPFEKTEKSQAKGDNGEIILNLQRELQDLQQEHMNKAMQTESLSSEHEQLFRDFLDACGFPWMVAISEAEAQCANLFLTGSVDGIITDDVDVFLFGGDNVYRHFFKNKSTALYYRIQDSIQFTREDLIIMSLFLGGDYGPGLIGYGPKKATALILDQTEEDRLCNVHDRVSRLRLSLPHQSDVERALSNDIVDAYLNPAVETVHYDRLRWGVIDKKRLRELLKRQAGWKDFDIDQSLNNLIKF